MERRASGIREPGTGASGAPRGRDPWTLELVEVLAVAVQTPQAYERVRSQLEEALRCWIDRRRVEGAAIERLVVELKQASARVEVPVASKLHRDWATQRLVTRTIQLYFAPPGR